MKHVPNLAHRGRFAALALALILAFAPAARGQFSLGTTFTYQGSLLDTGTPANGQFDFQFELRDDPTAGTLLGTVTANELSVNNGVFTASLDFGAQFDGDRRWLAISVRPGADSDPDPYTALTPRIELTAVPYALHAVSAGAAATATALETARDINGVAFDGTANITVADDTKVASNAAITGATNTKITYDAKGLVTAGVAATTADIADSADRRYVTDAQQTVIGNTSGTNTGDQTTITGNAATATALETARNINGVAFNGTANITVADDTKVATNPAIVGATNTKITYDAKGLVTGGTAATTADITDSTDRRYVTDADLFVIGSTSGTNTGNQTITLTGPVTGSGTGSFATTITDGAVGLGKMADLAGSTLVGRDDTGTGVPQALTLGTGLSATAGVLDLAGGVLSGVQVFTSDDTWTKPAGVTRAIVEVVGGGGAGGGATNGQAFRTGIGGGGGGGGYARRFYTSLGATEAVVVGLGGLGVSAASGAAGGTSSFGAGGGLVSATGGAGGFASNTGQVAGTVPGAAGGAGSGGSITGAGGAGGVGIRHSGTAGSGGGGGVSAFSGGAIATTATGAGASATGPGAGGAGGLSTTTSSVAGGDGAAGIVIVWEYK